MNTRLLIHSVLWACVLGIGIRFLFPEVLGHPRSVTFGILIWLVALVLGMISTMNRKRTGH